MTISKRQPCPCGSGKRYRNCCEKKENFFKNENETNENEFSIEDGYISFVGRSKVVKIPQLVEGQTVTGIKEAGFINSQIESVFIPKTVKEICNQAFEGCRNLKKVELSEGVETIGRYAFQRCISLTEVNIPATVNRIDGYAFDECYSLKKVDFLGDTIDHIGAYAFSETSITAIKLPKGLKHIANSLFYNCTNLIYCDIPETVESIYRMSFAGCIKLSAVYLPESVKLIRAQAFQGTELAVLVMPNELPDIVKNSFFDCVAKMVFAKYSPEDPIEILDSNYYDLVDHGMVNSVEEYLQKFSHTSIGETIEKTTLKNLMQYEKWIDFEDDDYNYKEISMSLKKEMYERFGWDFNEEKKDHSKEMNEIFEFEDNQLELQKEDDVTEADLYVSILNEGYKLKLKGDIEGAVEKCKQAIEFSPNLPAAYYNLGKLLYIKNEYKAAIRSYRMTLSLGHDLYDVLRHIGHALIDETMVDSKYAEVVAHYRQGINPYSKFNKVMEGKYKAPNPSNEEIDSYNRLCINLAERLINLLEEELSENKI